MTKSKKRLLILTVKNFLSETKSKVVKMGILVEISRSPENFNLNTSYISKMNLSIELICHLFQFKSNLKSRPKFAFFL